VLRHADGVKGQAASGANRKGESTEAQGRGGAARSGVEGSVMGLERRGCVVQPWPLANRKREEPVDEAKPFKIPKREVWEAFKRVKANQGAAGVDGQSIAEFEANLSGNLYKLWNRLSSGSYFPPPVRQFIVRACGDSGAKPPSALGLAFLRPAAASGRSQIMEHRMRDSCGKKRAIHVTNRCSNELRFNLALRHIQKGPRRGMRPGRPTKANPAGFIITLGGGLEAQRGEPRKLSA
jgi:hypothetical protein